MSTLSDEDRAAIKAMLAGEGINFVPTESEYPLELAIACLRATLRPNAASVDNERIESEARRHHSTIAHVCNLYRINRSMIGKPDTGGEVKIMPPGEIQTLLESISKAAERLYELLGDLGEQAMFSPTTERHERLAGAFMNITNQIFPGSPPVAKVEDGILKGGNWGKTIYILRAANVARQMAQELKDSPLPPVPTRRTTEERDPALRLFLKDLGEVYEDFTGKPPRLSRRRAAPTDWSLPFPRMVRVLIEHMNAKGAGIKY